MKSTVDFGTVEKESLPEKIAERIIKLIQEKHLLPGDRLPPERELAEMMGVSRPILREALRALTVMNIIENRQRAGTYITSLEPEKLVEHLEFIFSLEDNTYLMLLEARKVVESGLAEIAAKKITDDKIKELEGIVEKSSNLIDNPEAFLLADLELHRIISEAAQNPILSRFMTSITRISIHSRRRTSSSTRVREQTVKDHHAIVTSLKMHSPAAAKEAMLTHIQNIEKRLAEMTEGNP